MKRLLALFMILLMMITMLPGCGVMLNDDEIKVIGVIAKGDDSAFWRAVLIGAQDAAVENGYAITFRGTENQSPQEVPVQRDLMQLALDNNVVGLVVATVGEGFTDLLTTAKERKIPVVQFDSGIWPSDLVELKKRKKNPVVASVYTKNEEAGSISAEHLYDYIWRDIAASQGQYVVGVIQHDLTQSGTFRSKGFTERFMELAESNPETRGKCTIHRKVRSARTNGRYITALQELHEENVRAVYMTSGDVVDQVVEEIRKSHGGYDDVVFTGFDAGDRQLNWLRGSETPKFIGSVTQDAYQIGYRAVEQCVHALEARGVTAFVEIPAMWYDLSNLEDMIQMNLLEEG